MDGWILSLVIFAPLVGAVALAFAPRDDHALIRRVALAISTAVLALTVVAVVLYYHAGPKDGFRLTQTLAWMGDLSLAPANRIDIKYVVGIDGISLWLLLLSAFLMPLSIWGSFSAIQERVREYYCLMLLLQTGMMGVFCALDLLLFYVFFEFTLVPLFFLIGIWGGPERRRAANKFFIYTVTGSVLTFAGVLYIAYFAYAHSGRHEFTLDIQKLTTLAREGAIPANIQWWLFGAFAAGFAIKVPLFPLHTWLPLAHTEAPTAGSVILAGVLLKLGTYGFCRLSLPLLPEGVVAWAPFMAVLSIVGIVYAALAAWVQNDVKKLVAYSSVSHLGFCMLGMFSLKAAGLNGAVTYMVNHGLSTGALFLVVGMIYERYHTRDIQAIGGLARRMPWMAFFLIVFTLSSIGLPGLNGFVGEFLVLLGTATSATTRDGLPAGPLGFGYAAAAATGIILGAVYMLWMCERVLFGPLKEPQHTPDTSRGLTVDLTKREIGILAPIALACLVIGVWPQPMLKEIESATVANIIRAKPTSLAGGTGVACAGGHGQETILPDRFSTVVAPGGWHGQDGWHGQGTVREDCSLTMFDAANRGLHLRSRTSDGSSADPAREAGDGMEVRRAAVIRPRESAHERD
ncbi:MAG: NADH-quinone oxidoreductase subunit M [Planctomycetota bacterium]